MKNFDTYALVIRSLLRVSLECGVPIANLKRRLEFDLVGDALLISIERARVHNFVEWDESSSLLALSFSV